MVYELAQKPAPSRNPHLILPDTLTASLGSNGYSSWRAEAVWVGRKQGRFTVSHGTIGDFTDNVVGITTMTIPELLTYPDPENRYYSSRGSNASTRWDGETLWVDPAMRLDIDKHIRVIKLLDQIHKQVRAGNWAVPANMEGWWQPVKKTR